jgi:hypothetical protein
LRWLSPEAIVQGGLFMLAVALFVSLRRKGKAAQAIAAPVVLIATFVGVSQHELRRAYSIEVNGATLVAYTPLGATSANCSDIEFLIQKRKNVCVVRAFRGEDEVFYSVGVAWERCKDLQEQIRAIPCKTSDKKFGNG